jgi:hypothetical protein
MLVVLGLIACGSSENSTTPAVASTTVLKGTAASGAGILGEVTIKDSRGATKSAPINAVTGAYSVDVSGMNGPFVLRAKGTVGGRQVQYHSYATDADIDATINITPFTDLIFANVVQQLASSYFDSITVSGPPPASITTADIEIQEAALQAKLQAVLNALGVGSAIDLLHTPFSANRSGLDAVLDVVLISPDPSAPTTAVLIENLIDKTQLADAFNDPDDNSETLTVTSSSTVYTTQAKDRQAISQLFADITLLFASGLPSANQVTAKLTTDFLNQDKSGAQFAAELSTDPSLRGQVFSGLEIGETETDGTRKVKFQLVFNGVINPEPEAIFVKKVDSQWLLHGTQEIVDRWDGFYCQQYISTTTTRSCGLWLGADDIEFTNNGTADDVPIASARITLMRDGLPVSNGSGGNINVFMGIPTRGAAGKLRIYDADFSDDTLSFGSDARASLDPALLQADDEWRFELFTADLDLAIPTVPAVTGIAVATYSSPLRYVPVSSLSSNTQLLPTATQATLDALAAYTGGNINIAVSVATGQLFNEVYFEVCDSTQCIKISANGILDASGTTVSLDLSSLDNSSNYSATLRIYSVDENGQGFLSQYPKQVAGALASTELSFNLDNIPGTYDTLWSDDPTYHEFIFNVDNKGTVDFGNGGPEDFTWSIDDQGRLLVVLGSGLPDRYTLTSGTIKSGTFSAEVDDDSDGNYEAFPTVDIVVVLDGSPR